MVERAKSTDEISITYLSLKFLFIFLFNLEFVVSTNDQFIGNKINNHSCYSCVELLVGYTDHKDSCRFFNTTSSMGLSYIQGCNIDNYTGEYECRKFVVSYRSIDTYLRRDCVRKGLCSWKDRTQAMINTPVSDCVYTDDAEQKRECIYCCDTPLCNRTISFYTRNQFIIWLLFIYWWRKCNYYFFDLV